MLRKTIALVMVLIVALPLAACGQQDVLLQDVFPKEGVTGAQVEYYAEGEGIVATLETGSAEFSSLLNALYDCAPAQKLPESYSPELRGTHRIVLSSQAGSLTLYYDDLNRLLFYASFLGSRDDNPVRTYQAYAATLTNEMNAYRALATEPPRQEEDAVSVDDAALQVDIVAEEIERPGEPIAFQMFDYPYTEETPLYSVLTYRDQIAGLNNGYLLLVAAWGMKPTDGYIIDVASVEENDSYYIVRVTHDEPVEGAELSEEITHPVSAVLADARTMTEPKIIVFVDEGGEILALYRLDQDFLDELPDNMPAMATPDPYVDGAGDGAGEDADGET